MWISGEALTKAGGKKKTSCVYWQQQEIWITETANSGEVTSHVKNMKLYLSPWAVRVEEAVTAQGFSSYSTVLYLWWSKVVQKKAPVLSVMLELIKLDAGGNIVKFASLSHTFFFIYTVIGYSCRSFSQQSGCNLYTWQNIGAQCMIHLIWRKVWKHYCLIIAQGSSGSRQISQFSEIRVVASELMSREPW